MSKKLVRRPITELSRLRCPNCGKIHQNRAEAIICISPFIIDCKFPDLRKACMDYYYKR